MAVKNKTGLGRGLDALLGNYDVSVNESILKLHVHDIDTNLNQPRKAFDEDKLTELAASISRHGMVQPIIVRERGERYVIVAGERRFRAARLAGLDTIPAVVRNMDESEVLEVALVENIQRENLNPIEEAAAIRFLMQQHDYTQEEASSRLGKSRPAIANALRLLSLPPVIQEYLREGVLQAGHARALAGVKEARAQELTARRAVEEGWSVRRTEQAVRDLGEKAQTPAKKPRPEQDALLAHAAERFRERLGTKVNISGNSEKGKIVIEYHSKDCLEQIYEAIIGAEE